MKVDAILREIPECIAVGYVDMVRGTLLCSKTVDALPGEVLDVVASATGDLFRGRAATSMKGLLDRSVRRSGSDSDVSLQEVILLSPNFLHLFMRTRGEADRVLLTVCHLSSNLGLVLARARALLPVVEAA